MSYSNLQTVKPQIDFAILTALPVERKAVCKALRISDDMRVSKEGPAYWRGKLKLDDGSFYEIVVGQCAYPGNVEAAAMAVDALKTWNPQAALFIGVAGATNGTLKLGDIVPAGQIIYYELGKTTPEGMEPETRQYTADATLWQAVQTGVDWTEPILAERPDGTETRPAVVPGAIASGEKVIADAEYRDKICKRDRKINAIEMEGYGFSHAAWQQCSHVRALVIRSIVDFADGDKNSDWQQYAAAAAASYCANFLKGRPIPPRNIPGPANDKVRDDPALEGMLPIYVGDRPTSMLAVADDELLADIPGLPDPLVDSSAIVKHIHDKFGPNNKYIAVEGTFQTGKTVLLTQFAWAYRDRTFSVFTGTNLINSNLRSVLLTLCTQMQVYLVRQLPGLEALDTDKLLQAFHRLYKLVREKASKCKIPTFFIIDGVEWISRGQSGSSILQLLPAIPSNSTYLLVSARPDTELTGCITRVDVLPYSKADIREYLREYSICDDDLEKIFRLSGGLPGYLSLVRTRLEAGITPQNVVGDLAPDLHGMLEQEWTRSGIDGADAQLSMSIVAFAKSTIKARDLKTISANSRGKCSPTLDGNPFLRTHGPDGEISYISETHKQFVMTRMYAKRETAERLLIDYYSADPYNPVSMVSLESFLDTPQRYPKLKELVTAQYLQRRLMYTRSISAVRGNLAKLTKLASSKRDWQALPKYALASSMLTEILDRPVAQEEVEALVGLKKYSLALETAYQAILPEDQLQLLSYVYSRMRTDGYAITDTTIADLDAKALEISGEGLGSRAIEVAASLFDVRPQAALSLLERSTAGRAGDKAIDLARALLAIRLEFEEEHNDLHRTTEVISSSITDKTLRDFVKTVSPRLQQLTAAQLLGEIDNITNTSWRMFAFIAWCNANQEAADSGTIIERALDTITHDESYGVSMRQLRQLAEPLTHLNADVSQPLLERIDLIKNKALKRPIDELVRLEAVLASVEAPGDPEQAENRLLAAYFDLYKIDEIDGRCACLAQLLDALHIVKISRYEETRTEIETQLDSTFSQLLTTSADHQRTTRSLLKLLARVDPERALRYAKMLNLEDRRQTAYTDILLSHIDHAKGNLDTKVVDTILASFSMPQRYGVALASLLSRMAANNLLSERPDLEKYIDNIKSISFVEEACYACAHAICSLSAVNGTTKTEAIYTHLCVLLDQIDTDWGRARIRLRVASILARARPDLAGKFVDEATSLRSVTPLATDTFAPVYFNGVRLAIEALPDRIGKGRMQLDSYSRLCWLIDQVPSVNGQCVLYADLAMRLYFDDETELFGTIIDKQVLPLIERCQDLGERSNLITLIAPVLYCYSGMAFKTTLAELSGRQRNIALLRTVKTVVSRLDPDAPIDWNKSKFTVDFNTAEAVCSIIDQMSEDSPIYEAIQILVRSLLIDKKSDGTEQSAIPDRSADAIAKILEDIVTKKLPDIKNIQHTGYLVACRLQIARLRASAMYRQNKLPQTTKPYDGWDGLINEINSITNLADRCLVLGWGAKAMYHDSPTKAIGLMNDAQRLVYTIPILVDKVTRFYELALSWRSIDHENEGRKVLEEAMTTLLRLSEDPQSRDALSGKIIQLAHDISPEFASTLTNLIDDPAQEHRRHLEVRAASIRKNPSQNLTLTTSLEDNHEIISKAAWGMLSELNGKTAPVSAESTIGSLVSQMLGANFQDVYSVLALAIQTARRSTLNPDARIELFDGILSGLETCLLVGNSVICLRDTENSVMLETLPDSVKMLKSGQLELSNTTVREWILAHSIQLLLIYDPNFNDRDLDLISGVQSECHVYIITSWRGQNDVAMGSQDVETTYRSAWCNIFSNEVKPAVRVTILGTESGNSPIVGRFILTDSLGLNLTDLLPSEECANLLVLSDDETRKLRMDLVEPLLGVIRRDHQGEQLICRTFDL